MIISLKIRRGIFRVLIIVLCIAVALAGAVYFSTVRSAKQGQIEVIEPLRYVDANVPLGVNAVATAVIQVPWGQSLVGTDVAITPQCGVFVAEPPEITRDWLYWGKSRYTVTVKLMTYRTGTISPGVMKFSYLRPKAELETNEAAGQMAFPELEATAIEVVREEGLPLAGELNASDMKPNYVWVYLAGLVVAALAVMGYMLFKKLHQKAGEWFAPPTAWEEALEELKSLRGEIGSGYAGVCFARLSDIVRRYIERRYLLPSTTTTTPEFLQALRRSDSPLSIGQCGHLGGFLESADLVKFAKMEPDEAMLESSLLQAERFVKETIPSKEEVTNV